MDRVMAFEVPERFYYTTGFLLYEPDETIFVLLFSEEEFPILNNVFCVAASYRLTGHGPGDLPQLGSKFSKLNKENSITTWQTTTFPV